MRKPDDTMLASRRHRAVLPIAAAVLVAGLGLGGLALLLRPGQAPPAPVAPLRQEVSTERPAPLPPAPSPAPPAPAAAPLPPLATEAEILARTPTSREVYRFAPQPAIVVLQFATLADQADMLNRAAALIEKAGFPRDRVLGGAELDRMIRAGGETPETFYLGHDYRAADLVRFFAAAAQAGVALTAEEAWLQQAMQQWGWQSGATGALISLVREGPTPGLDRLGRAAILRHELSHGAYFTEPDYAAFAAHFWDTALTKAEREALRKFLRGEGYDTSLNDLVVNETQAYLMHTADRRFFEAANAGMTTARLDLLRALFLTGMPHGWLRDCTAPPAH